MHCRARSERFLYPDNWYASSRAIASQSPPVLFLLFLLFYVFTLSHPLPVQAFVNYGSYTVVVVASWCSALASVTLDVDFGAIGLDPAKTVLLTPSITSLQDGLPPRPWNTTLTVPTHGGLIGVLTANAEFFRQA
jgi:hypothetical protein